MIQGLHFHRSFDFLSRDLISRAVCSARRYAPPGAAPASRPLRCFQYSFRESAATNCDCPKCGEPMETVSFRHIEVERCTGCGGIWIDQLLKEELKRLPGFEAIDSNPCANGTPQKQHQCRVCAKCGGGSMIRMSDVDQADVSFDQCAVCGGSFFDAGELRKLKAPRFFTRFFC